jgi:hypothetical protein
MSYFRSYFEKNNTLINNSLVNTSKVPTTEIYYGSSYSRFIFKVDLEQLKEKINIGELVINDNTKHYLNLTNTIFGGDGFVGQFKSTGRQRATSFDLTLFQINETWDEGYGFDYEDTSDIENKTFSELPSNWYARTSLSGWTVYGAFTNGSTIVDNIHFDNGNENLKVDITNYVNGILSGNTNYGLGIKFRTDYENTSGFNDKSVAFFTKYTQTFYEPFVESVFDDRIDDNRANFIEKMDQNLYLYVTKGTNFYNLDELPIVNILDSNNNLITGLNELTTTKIKKGVYKVTFGIDNITCDGKRFFYDSWTNIKIDGVNLSDVKQKFIPKPYTNQFTIGANQTELLKYVIQFFGIQQNEKIKRGEKRKIVINFKTPYQFNNILFNEVYYRMFIKEGKTNVIIHDWTQIDNTNENSFTFDTSIYIPREYYIEVKAKTHTEEIFYNENIKFEIVSEK